ncbi:MAG: hypothetical protein QM775_08245 [Pirellulales bacterium]
MMALLSVFPPPSPRPTNIRQTFSRSSRRVEKAKKGSTLDRVF